MVGIAKRGYKLPQGIDFILENGLSLCGCDWNGECYAWKEEGIEVYFYPETVPMSFDEDGEAEEWEIVGFNQR